MTIRLVGILGVDAVTGVLKECSLSELYQILPFQLLCSRDSRATRSKEREQDPPLERSAGTSTIERWALKVVEL